MQYSYLYKLPTLTTKQATAAVVAPTTPVLKPKSGIEASRFADEDEDASVAEAEAEPDSSSAALASVGPLTSLQFRTKH